MRTPSTTCTEPVTNPACSANSNLETCVSSNRIAFEWYAFRRETKDRGEGGHKFRVFRGEHLRSEQLDKTTAAETVPYRIFFDINGNFKRQSVLRK